MPWFMMNALVHLANTLNFLLLPFVFCLFVYLFIYCKTKRKHLIIGRILIFVGILHWKALSFFIEKNSMDIRDKVFKNGPSKSCGIKTSKIWSYTVYLNRPHQVFWRLYSINFTKFVLEYFVSYKLWYKS